MLLLALALVLTVEPQAAPQPATVSSTPPAPATTPASDGPPATRADDSPASTTQRAVASPPPGEPPAPTIQLTEPPQRAVWVNVAPLVFYAALPRRSFAAAVGGSFVLSPRLVLTTDIAWLGATHPLWHVCADTGWVSWLSAGIALRPFGNPNALDGLSILPKVVVRLTTTGGRQTGGRIDNSLCTPPYANGTDVSVGIGATIGWNWVVWRHLYLGIGAGGSLLACFSCASNQSQARLPVDGVWELDAQGRLGVSF
ncbi:MAG: hypothetical protein JNJ54_36415 [Myxococcaceae bacterium]|nr:hypothetical protein [Myxococcaceae bacterium]